MLNKKIAFIGGGNMAEGIIKAMIQEEACSAEQINVSDVVQSRLDYLAEQYQLKTFTSIADAIADVQMIFVAVRPQDAAGVFQELKEKEQNGSLVISICAGITLAKMQSGLGDQARLARVMPNVLSDAHHGYSGICLSAEITSEDKADLTTLFNALGKSIFIEESQFDAFTAFSCAGPAYIMECISGLIDAGVQSGFSRSASRDMVLENFIGSGLALDQSGEHPLARVDKMTSPGGITIDGISSLNKAGLTGILMAAVGAALKRTKEL